MQLAVLVIQELSAAVSRASHEIIETLVVLHQIRLNELIGADFLVIFDHLQVAFCRYLELETFHFFSEDVLAEFLARPSFRVFVDRQQFVEAVDGQFQFYVAPIRYLLE